MSSGHWTHGPERMTASLGTTGAMDFFNFFPHKSYYNSSGLRSVKLRQNIILMIDIWKQEQRIFYKNTVHSSHDCVFVY